MFKLAAKIPNEVVLAVSGGVDSMALLSFCQAGKKNITVLHIDHGTPHAKDARRLVETYCRDNNLELIVREVPASIAHTENNWREFRLGVYREFSEARIPSALCKWVATAHHLDDSIEWYLLTALHGATKFMQPIDANHKRIKPFLFVEKEQLIKWCDDKNIPYVTDPTNIGEDNSRAILRESVIPNLLKIHPGMKASIKNKMLGLL